jgi:hypothetical protein
MASAETGPDLIETDAQFWSSASRLVLDRVFVSHFNGDEAEVQVGMYFRSVAVRSKARGWQSGAARKNVWQFRVVFGDVT